MYFEKYLPNITPEKRFEIKVKLTSSTDNKQQRISCDETGNVLSEQT